MTLPNESARRIAKDRDPERPGKWFLTDFTMEQVEGRLRDLEALVADHALRERQQRGDFGPAPAKEVNPASPWALKRKAEEEGDAALRQLAVERNTAEFWKKLASDEAGKKDAAEALLKEALGALAGLIAESSTVHSFGCASAPGSENYDPKRCQGCHHSRGRTLLAKAKAAGYDVPEGA